MDLASIKAYCRKSNSPTIRRCVEATIDLITPVDKELDAKFRYVGQFLIICVLTSTKLSMIVFYKGLTQQKRVILACDCLLGLVIGWAIFSVFTIAFQCNLRDPWVYSPGRCTAEVRTSLLLKDNAVLINVMVG